MAVEEQPRPFGLLLLTGLSFGVAIWNLMAGGQTAVAHFYLKQHPTTEPGIDVAVLHSQWALPSWVVVFLLASSVVNAALLFVAAWGYFNFRRVTGRLVGTAYGVLSLAESGVMIATFGFQGLPTIIGMLFAVFTLLAVNGPFKPLLVR